jgi:sugar-specific transcriptional regulator TrmB
MEISGRDNPQVWLDLGLSKSEATVYLVLSKLGQAKARDIWKLAQVARQDIYRILEELIDLGIVERVMKNPCEFRTFPLAESFEILLQQMEEDKKETILRLHQEAAQFVKENANVNMANCNAPESEFSICEGEANLLKMRKAMEQSKSTVELIIHESIVLRDDVYFEEALREALRRGVKVRFLLEKTDENSLCGDAESRIPRSRHVAVRTISRNGLPAFAIYDEREASFVALSKSQMSPKLSAIKPPALWTNNPFFVSIVHEYFENVWQQANESRKALR